MSHPVTEPIPEGMPARYWHLLDDGRIQCDVCPRYCKLHEGQRGLCFVRARHENQIVLTFGTAGCNLTCKFCQNWDISKARAFDRLQDLASPEAIAEAATAPLPAPVLTRFEPEDR